MPGLTELRDAAVELLRIALPEVCASGFAGELTVETVKNRTLPLKAVFVTAIEAQNIAAPETLDFDMSALFGAFVLTRKGDRDARDADGLRLAEAAAQTLHGATFGVQGVSPARVQSLSSMPDEAFEKAGINIWAVVWQQALVFDPPALPSPSAPGGEDAIA